MENAYDFARPITDWEYTCIEISEPIDGVKLITLNRPECLNAISIKEARDLENALQELRFDNRCRVVILTGAGRGFCAGTDLKEMSEFTKDPEATRNTWLLQKHMANIIELMRHIPQPIIAAVNGPAAGGGASFVMATDIRIASTNAKFINAHINVGMSGADMGSSFMLPRLIGVSKAAELIYTGRPVLAEEGERIGLFKKIVAPEELMDTALEYAKTLLGKSEMGLLLTKECLNAAMDGVSLDAQLHLENRSQTLCAAVGSFGKGASNFANREGKK